ncbi:DUF4249 family protein [Flagellimonas pacifica]|uniref:DUF4249 domain-containing protein n=1 Tax=Flagellimonas pacifica TaxID=1247520 RepID=A0A285MTX0_9FLAO|nr:DUF4249 family protein [Allomuricauda parva]SNZ00635.1 protein of unknown function [Allomuricauda parva]
MKKFIPFLFFVFALISCEDVVQIDVPQEEPRLIINGIIRVDESKVFVPVEIKVTETNNFFGETPVTQLENALIIYGQPNPDAPELLDNLATSALAESPPGSGIYIPDPTFDVDQRIQTASLLPNTIFTLLIDHKGRSYAARTPYSKTTPIDNLVQGDETLFDEDDTEIKITFTDALDEDNYYVFDFGFGEFLALEDEFIDGQQFEFSYFYQKDLEPNQEVEISIMGADQQFFNYMNLLVEQTQNDGGVFETPAATVRGNMFDVTDLDNIDLLDNVEQPNIFPLGYFAVVQEYKQAITIQQ